MDVERSELLLEPGLMIPKELVELLFNFGIVKKIQLCLHNILI